MCVYNLFLFLFMDFKTLNPPVIVIISTFPYTSSIYFVMDFAPCFVCITNQILPSCFKISFPSFIICFIISFPAFIGGFDIIKSYFLFFTFWYKLP